MNAGGEGPGPGQHVFAIRMLRLAPRRASFGAVLVAIGFLAIGMLVRMPLDAVSESPLPPYITIYPLLPFIGFFCGFRVGVGVVAAAIISAWYFLIPPTNSFDIPDMRTGLTLLIFAMAGPVAVGFGALARRALEQVVELHAAADRNAHEAVHRTKNIITAVKAVARGEARRTSDMPAFVGKLDDTLSAMARAQDVLISAKAEARTVAKLVEAGVASCSGQPQLVVAGGPDIAAPEGDFSGLVLALHELCTNSLKYGALASETGRVDLSWQLEDRCRISWNETAPTVREGADSFGSMIIRGALAKVDGGEVDYQREPGRIRCDFSWPARPALAPANTVD